MRHVKSARRRQFADRRGWTAHVETAPVPKRTPTHRAPRLSRHRADCRCENAQACAAFDRALPAVQVVDVVPVPKPRMTGRDRFRKRASVLRYRAYADALRAAGLQLPHGCVCVCYLPMPRSWPPAKKRELHGTPHRPRPDASNLLKAIEDACCANDARLDDVRCIKRWADSGRVLVMDASRVDNVAAAVARFLPHGLVGVQTPRSGDGTGAPYPHCAQA